jgi:Ca-activated chloride channel homolog
MKKTMLFMALFLSLANLVLAQRTIKGTVTDGENKEPLVGATVVLKGTKIGTLTDVDGHYSLKISPKNNVPTLVFAFTGYTTKDVAIGQLDSIDIALEGGTLLQEVIVTGYSVQQKKMQVSGAISNVTTQSLSGRVAGISINKNGKKKDKKQEPIGTEKYSHKAENDYKNPKKEPLSTFSIDVDKAAYANVRRYLNDNTMPPKDAVRIEEMINYFDYKLPQPTTEHAVAVQSEVGICPWNKTHYLMKVDVQAVKKQYSEAPANNFVFLIDVSGSMSSPDKLGLLKDAFKVLVTNLRAKDYVSIVTYAGNAGLVLDATSGSEKETILDALNRLESGGSTAGGQGIELAYKVAEENFDKQGNNRVILATDGDFNVGVSSTEDLENLIVSKRENDIFLSVLGFGTGNINDEGMETLADKGNGNYFYIDNLKEANKVFDKELTGTILTVAKDVKFQIEFNPLAVESYRLVGYENRLLNDEDFNDDKKDAGEIGAGNSVTALYEIIPKGVLMTDSEDKRKDALRYQTTEMVAQNNVKELAFVKMRYKKPLRFKSSLLSQSIDNQILNLEKTSDNFRFAAAVAAFGQVIKESAYKGDFDYRKIIDLAESAKGSDTEGYRQEFINLVEKCIKITNNH